MPVGPLSNLEEEMGVQEQDWGWVVWAIEVSQMASGGASMRPARRCHSPSQGPEGASFRLSQGGSEVGELGGWEGSVVASRA